MNDSISSDPLPCPFRKGAGHDERNPRSNNKVLSLPPSLPLAPRTKARPLLHWLQRAAHTNIVWLRRMFLAQRRQLCHFENGRRFVAVMIDQRRQLERTTTNEMGVIVCLGVLPSRRKRFASVMRARCFSLPQMRMVRDETHSAGEPVVHSLLHTACPQE
jgi:hypothetical protein